jgi:hypothetical protein
MDEEAADGSRSIPWGAVFAIAAIALGLILVVDVFAMELAGRNVAAARGNTTNESVVYVQHVETVQGEVVHADPDPPLTGAPVELRAFHIVPGGEWTAFKGGATTDDTLRTVDAAEPLVGDVAFEHPASVSEARGLDLVWVYGYSERAPRTDDPEAQAMLETWASASVGRDVPEITAAWASPLHKGLLAAGAVTGLVALLAGGAWIREEVRRRRPGEAGTVEGGLGLVELGGRYLRYQRGLLLALLVPLAIAGWMTMIGLDVVVEDAPGPWEGWAQPVIAAAVLLWIAVVVGVIALLVRVQLDLSDWRSATEDPPGGFQLGGTSS